MDADRVTVKVRRMDIPRFRLFQVAAWAGVVLSVICQRVPGFPVSVCIVEFSLALILGLRSYRYLGRREIAFVENHLVIGQGPAVHPRDLRMWVMGEGEVRLYMADLALVWRLVADDSQLEVFRARLTKSFGKPKVLIRRGSRRGRVIAGGLTLAGVGAFPLALRLGPDFYGLGVLGVLVAAFAFTSFMFSSQKVVRRDP